jgi:hypothetical protein
MATKRRRLKTKNKKKNNKTRKVGGINLVKELWGTDDAEDAAAKQKKKEEEGIELQDLGAIKSDSIRNAVLLPQIYSKGVSLSNRLNEADAAAQDPIGNADELNRFLDEASKSENKEELVEEDKTNEAQSEPVSVDIAKIAREVSLAAREAADALEAMKVDVKKADLIGDEVILDAASGTEEEEKVLIPEAPPMANSSEDEEEQLAESAAYPNAASKTEPSEVLDEIINDFKNLTSSMKDATTIEEITTINQKGEGVNELGDKYINALKLRVVNARHETIRKKLRPLITNKGKNIKAAFEEFQNAKKQKEAELNEVEIVDDDKLMEKLETGIAKQDKEEKELIENINKLADIEALGVAAGNVADAIREVAIKLKPNEDKGTVAPMPSVVTLPNSDEDADNLSLVLRKPDVLKAESGIEETMGECPSANIEITEEEDGAFSFKGMTEPKNKGDCKNKRTLLTLYPDRNKGCKDKATEKFQNFKNFCQRFEEPESSDTESSDEESSDTESSDTDSSDEESSGAKPQPDPLLQVTAPLPGAAIIDPATKIKQIKTIVNPAIQNLLSKLSPVSDQLRKQVTDYKKYTELLTTHHPNSKSGGGSPAKPTMAQLAQNVMENGFIIGIERPVDDETYKAYEYSNYKIFADELLKSTEPGAKTVLTDFKENEMKYRKAIATKLTDNEKMRLVVDSLYHLEEDTNGGSIIIRNYAIHTTKGTVPEIMERYKDVTFLREQRIELQREILRILKTKNQLTNSDYIKYMTLKELFEWLKPKYVLRQYKLEGDPQTPLFSSFGEDFIKKIFSGRAKTMKDLEYSIDALINKKIIAYDPGSDNGLIDNLKCYKKGKPKCNEIEYLELEKFPEQLKALILADENSSTSPQYKEISELAKLILADYTKKYAKKYTRKNQKPLMQNMTLKNQPKPAPKPVIIRPKFNVAIESDLKMIGYDKVKIPNPTPILITINKTGLTINNEVVDTKDKWDAVREMYLGYGKSQDDFKLPTYTNGELRFIIDTQAQKIAVYINKGKEILINNMKQLEELRSALNKA